MEEMMVTTNRMIGKIELDDQEWSKREFSLEHLNEDTGEKLIALIRGYPDSFLKDNVVLTSATEVKNSITLKPGAQPICKAPYRIPYHQPDVFQKEIDRLMDAAIIRTSFSPSSAPVVLVTKKLPNGEEKVRMCIDYRWLNNVTKEEYYPLPDIPDLIQGYNSESEALFSVIVVAEAYHQINMGKKDILLTGFSTFQGHNEYLKMPFGSVNAPSTFQRFMNITLEGLTGELCMVYLDDIIIFNSAGKKDHIGKQGKVFERLREANVE
ncbi:hypothetical protein JTB14_013888 [Gonioctena quinquepunctata]|nr:hypothetical protein JTB14_013888 [Gonioctena quinquepunctata]